MLRRDNYEMREQPHVPEGDSGGTRIQQDTRAMRTQDPRGFSVAETYTKLSRGTKRLSVPEPRVLELDETQAGSAERVAICMKNNNE